MEQHLVLDEWWRPEPPAQDAAAAAADASRGRLAFRALLAFTVILVAAPQSFVPALAGLRPALVAAATASLAYLLGRASGRLPIVARAPERVFAGAMFAWALVTIPVSFWPGGALQAVFDPYIQSLVLFWLIAATVTSEARLRTLAWTLALCSIPLAVAGLRHYADGLFVAGRVEGYASGLAGNPNDLALMLVVILPLTVSLVSVARRLPLRLLLVGIALLQIAAIVTTFSRGGFIALMVVLGACVLRLVRRRALAPAVLAVLVLAGGAALLPSGYGARLGTIADMNADPTGSAQARWHDTLAAVQFIERHPFVGAGVGLDYLALNEVRGSTFESVHDAYLKAGVDLGLLGMALYVLLLASSLVTARRAELGAERAGLADVSLIAGGARIALVAFVVAAFFYPIPYHPYFYLLAGLALSAQGILREHVA